MVLLRIDVSIVLGAADGIAWHSRLC